MRSLIAVLLFSAVVVVPLATRSPTELPADELLASLAPPPASDEDELNEVIAQQARTSPEDQRRIYEESFLNVFTFGEQIDNAFTAAQRPRTARLFDRVDRETQRIIAVAHARWPRARPQAAGLQSLQPDDCGRGGYPAADAVRARVFARILREMFPSRGAALLHRSDEIAQDTIAAGEQFPSDVSAGIILGDRIADRLLNSSALRQEIISTASEQRQ